MDRGAPLPPSMPSTPLAARPARCPPPSRARLAACLPLPVPRLSLANGAPDCRSEGFLFCGPRSADTLGRSKTA